HHAVLITESPRQEELAAERGDHPAAFAVADVTALVAVAEQGDLATELEVLGRIEPIEAADGRAGEGVLADPGEHHPLQVFAAVLAKPRHVELNNCTGTAVGCLLRVDRLRQTRFAVT